MIINQVFGRIYCILLPIFLLLFFRGVSLASDATLVLTVVDELGAPVSKANVAAGWNGIRAPGTGVGAGPGNEVAGTTDELGSVTLSIGGMPEILIKKDGYYSNGLSAMVDCPKLFSKEPFSVNYVEAKIILSKVRKSFPMCVKKVQDPAGKIPAVGKPCGFDLEIGDWVAPNGAGKVTDFIFTMNFEYRGARDYDYICTLLFPNDGDGIQLIPVPARFRMNELRLPREAPIDGYVSQWTWNTIMGLGVPKFALRGVPSNSGPSRDQENDNYIYRVRTTRSSDGKIISARYGKIHGRIVPCIRLIFPTTPKETYPCIEFLYLQLPFILAAILPFILAACPPCWHLPG